MTHFLKSGDRFDVSPNGALDIHEKLPTGSYIVKFDDQRNLYYLVQAEPFGSIAGKVYGDTEVVAKRVLNTYKSRSASTGILLAGEKGSGKTMLAKMLSFMGALDGIPTLIINTPHCGDTFNKFIQDIDQECIVLFDEYEKIYDEEDQEKMLTLLDGVFPQKKLFILTCNNVSKLDTNLKNRPGRIFYFLEYEGLDEDFVREYAEDNLKDKSQLELFIKVAVSLFDTINFDMMKAIIEEMNRYGESVKQVLKYLNTKPQGSDVEYSVDVFGTDPDKKVKKVYTTTVHGNPLDNDHCIYIKTIDTQDESSNHELSCYRNLLTGADLQNGTFEYKVEGFDIRFTRNKKSKGYDYMAF